MKLTADEALLFRFSALTYNAHRIHYDHDWVREEVVRGGRPARRTRVDRRILGARRNETATDPIEPEQEKTRM